MYPEESEQAIATPPKLVDLLDCVDGDIAGSGDHDVLAFEAFTLCLEHFGDEVRDAVAGGLGANLRSAPGDALAGEDARLVRVGQPLVLTEQVADLATADADVAGRNVGVFTDVTLQFGHEGLTEAHDLCVGAALGIEVRATLAAADGQAGE